MHLSAWQMDFWSSCFGSVFSITRALPRVTKNITLRFAAAKLLQERLCCALSSTSGRASNVAPSGALSVKLDFCVAFSRALRGGAGSALALGAPTAPMAPAAADLVALSDQQLQLCTMRWGLVRATGAWAQYGAGL